MEDLVLVFKGYKLEADMAKAILLTNSIPFVAKSRFGDCLVAITGGQHSEFSLYTNKEDEDRAKEALFALTPISKNDEGVDQDLKTDLEINEVEEALEKEEVDREEKTVDTKTESPEKEEVDREEKTVDTKTESLEKEEVDREQTKAVEIKTESKTEYSEVKKD